ETETNSLSSSNDLQLPEFSSSGTTDMDSLQKVVEQDLQNDNNLEAQMDSVIAIPQNITTENELHEDNQIIDIETNTPEENNGEIMRTQNEEAHQHDSEHMLIDHPITVSTKTQDVLENETELLLVPEESDFDLREEV